MALPWHIPLETIKNFKNVPCPEPTLLKHFCNLNIHENPKDTIQTGIMCDIGVDNMDPSIIKRFIKAGMTIAKLKVKDVDKEQRNQLIQAIRQAVYNYTVELNYVYPLALVTEIVKPEITTGYIKGGLQGEIIELEKNQKIRLTTDISWKDCGTVDCLYVGWSQLTDLQPNDNVYIDNLSSDIKIKLVVSKVGTDSVVCIVEIGGIVGSQMTVRVSHVPKDSHADQSGNSSESIICSEENSEKHIDNIKQQLEWAIGTDIDAIIIPNAESSDDIRFVKNSLSEKGRHILIISSIESITGLDNIDEILVESDGVCFDRSILRCDLPVEKIFAAQKVVIAKCKAVGKPCICKAVINEFVPTMCVTDIANLILDGIDVLSLELHYDSPLNKLDPSQDCIYIAENCISAASVVCRNAERVEWLPCMYSNLDLSQKRLEEPTKIVCVSAVEMAMRSNAAVIICLTSSGRTAKTLSHVSSICPIVAVTRTCHTARQLRFWRGIQAIHYFENPKGNWNMEVECRIRTALDFCKSKYIIKVGDPYIAVTGSRRSVGYCDSLRLLYASARHASITE